MRGRLRLARERAGLEMVAAVGALKTHAPLQTRRKSWVIGTRRSGPSMAKYMGEGVLIYFGYPQAHEDDAERAVRGN
jgi:class 3 adenylate cyclase